MIAQGRAWKRWLVAGLVLSTLSRGFEAMGDAAPFAESGVSGERLMFHSLALALLLAAIACGIKLIAVLLGSVRDTVAGSPQTVARVFSETPQAPGEFDPDAAFERYMAKKASGDIEVPAGPAGQSPPRAGFGRKGA